MRFSKNLACRLCRDFRFAEGFTGQINLLRDTEGQVVWQRNYYEHIVRNEPEMDRITRYIESNPLRWADDDENSNRVCR